MENKLANIQRANNPELSVLNKERELEYRENIELTKAIYDITKAILDSTLGPNYTLPINVKTVAEKLGFVISEEDFTEIEQHIVNHDCLPIAQLRMRRRLEDTDNPKIRGTIILTNQLNNNSTRFSIAHQLGHFALREQAKIGLSFIQEPCEGLYSLCDTSEMLADLFADALLLPYHLFVEERKKYESIRAHWPLDYGYWILYIRDKAQMPEYHAVLACQEIKKIGIHIRYEAAQKRLNDILCELAIFDAEEQLAALELFAITINNLEAWGYSKKQVADFLFKESNKNITKEEQEIIDTIIDFMHDFYIRNNLGSIPSRTEYPSEVIKQIVNQLRKSLVISINGISKITMLPEEVINQQALSRCLPKDTQE